MKDRQGNDKGTQYRSGDPGSGPGRWLAFVPIRYRHVRAMARGTATATAMARVSSRARVRVRQGSALHNRSYDALVCLPVLAGIYYHNDMQKEAAEARLAR